MRLIYLSPVPWGSFSQRPHELVRYFHSVTESKVLWVDPYPGRFPTLTDMLTQRPQPNSTGCDIPRWLTVVKPQALPIEPLPFSAMVNSLLWGDVIYVINQFANAHTILGIGKPSTLALQLLSKQFFSSFYDAMDDYPSFYKGWSRAAMANREHKIIRTVSTVLTSSLALRDRLLPMASDVRLVPNACAVDRLPRLRRVLPPEKDHRAVVGYVGTIAHWFDWELVIRLARSHPEKAFRLIGPMYASPDGSLPCNIYPQPMLSHEEALQAMSHFDVGLIPFRNTTLTASVDPIKFYEYLAMGLPVVSSAFGEMTQRDGCPGVYLIDQRTNLTDVINKALAHRTTFAATARFRSENSWQKRFDQAKIFTLPV